MEAIIFWHPYYRLAGVIKLATAIVSWATVLALIPIVPRVLAMRSPEELEREIVARKRAEAALQDANAALEGRVRERTEELRRERERLGITLESIGDAVISTDAAGTVTFLNSVAQALTGWTRDEAVGRPLAEVFQIRNDRTGAPADNPVETVLREGRVVGLANHTVLVARDGVIRPIEDSAAPIRDFSANIVGVVLVFHDISEKAATQRALHDAEEQFQVLADNIPQLAWMTRPDGHIFWYNRRWYEYTGTTFADMEGWGWQSVHDPAELPRVIKKFKDHIERGEPWEDIFPLRRHDGEMRWHLSRAQPVQDENGRVARWFGTNTDITEQRNLERQLQDADRRKDEFLATLAHELRNPLAPIRTGLQIIRQADGDNAAIEKVRAMMERQLTQLVHLVDDLMDVSRITRGKVELRREVVPLAILVNSAVEACRPLIEQMGHELRVSLPDPPIIVNADVTRMAQVFANILTNAAKYSDRGSRITLTAERADGEVVVSVRDTGRGIAADQLPHIFEMFSQVHSSLPMAQGGLGIGLTLVKRLVGMHGGSITAASDGPGRGSEFTVRLPAVTEPAAPVNLNESTTPTSAAGLRVLVVDDNRDSADSLTMMLGILGHRTRTAYDGEQALAVALDFRPDVLLLDIGLPKLDGYEVCRRLRERPEGKAMMIVAQSGLGQNRDRQLSREAGFDHHFVKPVDPKAIMKILATVQPIDR